jgi:hypothetical protein
MDDMWQFSTSSTNQWWAWMSGTPTPPQSTGAITPVYGTLGVASASNVVGSRTSAVTWTDAAGKFWLFAGSGAATNYLRLTDLWRFDPTTNLWTWMGGATVGGTSDAYGTLGIPSATNIPSGRNGSAAWSDGAGNLWFFGGYRYPVVAGSVGDLGIVGDFWRYNIATGLWTWVGGSTASYASATYGTLGTPAPQNSPGARQDSAFWVDRNGNFWLFGGITASGVLNDLWRF